MYIRWKIKVKMRQQLATTRSINIDQGSVSVDRFTRAFNIAIFNS